MTTHASALERTLKSSTVLSTPENAATVQLARTLAAAMDATDAPTARTLTAYASVLGQLRRVVRDAPAAPAREATRLSQMKDGAKP